MRLEGCGISEWHLPLWEGRPGCAYPQEAGAPGHEGWGWVDAIGAGVDDVEVGQRVAVMSGHAYAQFVTAPRDCIAPLPEELDDEPFPGEVFARAINIFERADVRAGHTVAIVGAGFVGLLLTQLASDRGAHVVVISRRRHELDLAESMDAEETILTRGEGADAERAARLVGDAGFDRVIELAGTRADVDVARRICGERGRLVIASGYRDHRLDERRGQGRRDGGSLVVLGAHLSNEAYVTGVRKAIQAALEGRLDPFPLMSHVVPMGSLDTGFALTRERPEGFVKALLLPQS